MKILPIAMLLCSSLGAQTIYQKVDKFTGAVQFYTFDEEPKIEGGSFFSQRHVYFGFTAIKPILNANAPYTLKVKTTTAGWVFIKGGESLILKLDGEVMPLSGEGSVNSRELYFSDLVNETATYPLTLEQLRRIGRAAKVEFRLFGDRQVITGEWKAGLIGNGSFFAKKAPELVGDLVAAPKTEPSAPPAPPSEPSEAKPESK